MNTQVLDTVLLPTAFFPNAEHFAYLLQSKQALIEIEESYAKQTYRNRCEIFSSNGKLSLSIPVHKTFGNNTLTKDIRITDHDNWQLKYWRAIKTAYNLSPFLLYYQDDLQPFFEKKYTFLIDLNREILLTLYSLLEIEINFEHTSYFEKKFIIGPDLRNSISPKKPSDKINFPRYIQCFDDKHGFLPNLSILDILFNLGPETEDYLRKIELV